MNDKFNVGGLPWVKNPKYNHLRGYVRYVVDVKGNMIDTEVNKEKTYYIDKYGYRMVQLRDDSGNRKIIGRHRVLALAFLEPMDDFNKLDVNHLDGIPGNDTLDNLEWSSRSNNCHHAYRTGLRSDQYEVVLRSGSGVIKTFYSATQAANFLNVTPATILNRCAMPDKNFDGYYHSSSSVKVKAEALLWTNHPVEVLEIKSNDIFIFTDPKEMYKKYPEVKGLAARRLTLDSLQPLKGLIFRSIISNQSFPKITERYKEYWDYYTPGSTPIKVYDENGNTKIYSSIGKFSLDMNFERNTVSKNMVNGKYKNWVIEKLTPA